MRAERVVRCEAALASVLDEGAVVALDARLHLRRCPQCRQEVAGQRALRGQLRALGGVPATADSRAGEGLLAAILSGLDREDRRVRRVRLISSLALAGAVAGGVAAGVAAGTVAKVRGRRLALRV